MDPTEFFISFQDYLAPKLDMYEQAIYLYVFRHSRLIGKEDVVIGFKSARTKLAFGIGKQGTPPSEAVVYEKLRSLQSKGCLTIVSSEQAGTRLKLHMPSEISGVIPEALSLEQSDIELTDFFTVTENRLAILRRECGQCFYCLRKIDEKNYVIEHVVSRPEGGNSYRNLVAACRQCNNRKGPVSAEDFLRSLYREGLLSQPEFEGRLSHLERLKLGELKPGV